MFLLFNFSTCGKEAWYGTTEYVSNKIDVLQKKAIKCIADLLINEHKDEHEIISGNFLFLFKKVILNGYVRVMPNTCI